MGEVTNLQFVKHEEVPSSKKLFINNVNTYQGSAVVKILNSPGNDEIYEVFGTLKTLEEESHQAGVTILDPDDDSFMDSVLACDLIIYDIAQDWSAARRFLKYFEAELENSRVDRKKQFILVSTIMTWAQTHQENTLTDLNYRKRKPHPCFTNHLSLERDVINLSKKYKNLVETLVVCPGIVYGGKQEILHFVYKKCYFNNSQIDIFAPGSNHLPLIYIEDYANVMNLLIHQFPDSNFPYILLVQPEPLQAKNLISILAESAGGPETRIRACEREEIFLMDEELMTVRFFYIV